MTPDTIVRGGLWFDGSGAPGAVRDVAITAGVVTEISAEPIAAGPQTRVIEAEGAWVMPGMVDIHTHYDVEVLDGPGLSESVRHGVTTVLLGSCSLSTVHVEPVDAGDLFGRVEAIPRLQVIDAVQRHRTWHDPASYRSEEHTSELQSH